MALGSVARRETIGIRAMRAARTKGRAGRRRGRSCARARNHRLPVGCALSCAALRCAAVRQLAADWRADQTRALSIRRCSPEATALLLHTAQRRRQTRVLLALHFRRFCDVTGCNDRSHAAASLRRPRPPRPPLGVCVRGVVQNVALVQGRNKLGFSREYQWVGEHT